MESIPVIDPELKALIPPLSEKEHALLEKSLLAEGCRDALIVWDEENILIDGHHRYGICQRHNLPFQIVHRSFDSRADVKIWMVNNQLGRRNIPEALRVELALQLKPLLEDQAIARRNAHLKRGSEKPAVDNLPPPEEAGKTRDNLAARVGMSGRKFDKAEYVLQHAPDYIQALYKKGKVSVHRAYTLTRNLESAHPDVRLIADMYGVIYPETVTLLNRLESSQHKAGSNGTFKDIWATGYIQPGEEEEAVPITAHPTVLEQAITVIRKAHIKLSNDERVIAAQTLDSHISNVLYVDGTITDMDILPHTLSDDDIQIAKNAACFIWVTPTNLVKGLTLLADWGFTYKTQFIWTLPESEATPSPMFIREQHQILLLGTRGSFKPLDMFDASVILSMLQTSTSSGAEKQDPTCTLIERLYPNCNYTALIISDEWLTRKGWSFTRTTAFAEAVL